MPIFQVIGESSKNQVDPKEDTEKASPNVGMASRLVQIRFAMSFLFLTCHFDSL